MNINYRSIYNSALGAWVAVSELAKSREKLCRVEATSNVFSSELPGSGFGAFFVKPVVAALGACWLLLGGGAALAACSGSGGSYTCSGTTGPTQSLGGGGSALNVTVDSTFNSAGGLDISGTNGLNISTAAGSNILTGGGASGIHLWNLAGDTTLTLNGDMTGTTGSDNVYMNSAGGKNLTVQQNGGTLTTTGSGWGAVFHSSETTGDVIYNQTAGSVISQADALYITRTNNTANTGDIIVTQSADGTFRGNNQGIHVQSNLQNVQGGGIYITTAGEVTGANSAAIEVSHRAFYSPPSGVPWMTIKDNGIDIKTSGLVNSIANGIKVGSSTNNTEGGGIRITTEGDVNVTGTSGYGIYVGHRTNYAPPTGAPWVTLKDNGVDIVTTGRVNAGAWGIAVHSYNDNKEGGGVRITVEDDVTLTGDYGASSAIDVVYSASYTPPSSGPWVTLRDNGVDIKTTGRVSGAQAGISVFAGNAYKEGGGVRITTANDVTAEYGSAINVYYGTTGIHSGNPALTVDGVVITQTAGSIKANGIGSGIYVENNSLGETRITTAGDVSTTNGSGIYITHSDKWVGSLNTNGVTVEQTGGSILSSAGLSYGPPESYRISGDGNGIYVNNISHGATTLKTAGTVTALDGAGIFVQHGLLTPGLPANAPANTNDLTITQTAGDITGMRHGIYAENGGTGATTINIAGTVSATGTSAQTESVSYASTTTNDGTTQVTTDTNITATNPSGGLAIATRSASGNNIAITLDSGANVFAASGLAIHDTDGNATVTLNPGAKVSGQIALGEGNDKLIIRGNADLSNATLLDGGSSSSLYNRTREVTVWVIDLATGTYTSTTTTSDIPGTDILGTAGAATNKLSFEGSTQTLAGSIMKNWQTVTLDGSNVTFSGDAALTTGTGTNPDGSLQGLVLKNGSTLTSPVAMAVVGDVAIDATSTVSHALGGSITGNVTNAGLIYWKNLGQTLTVNGNYVGVPGSRLSLETHLADDSSVTDKLHVTGDTSGTSAITVRPAAGSPGAQTVDGIKVVQVDALSAASSFTMAAPVQAGAYEYILRQGGTVSGGQSWYLTSTYVPPTPPIDPTVPPGPAIYRPGIANYVSGQAFNIEQGLLQVSTYHQRQGQEYSVDTEGRLSWLRPYYTKRQADGDTRFNYDGDITGVQMGHDLWMDRDDDGVTRRAAVTFDYARGNMDATDRMRALGNLDTQTGSLKADSVALGGTYTWANTQGGYVDLVGQVTSLRNHYRDHYGDSALQTGWGTTLSVEVGQPVAGWGDWTLEPQAQLTYMHLRFKGFDDAVSYIDGYSVNALRGRIGARLLTETENKVRAYGIVNLLYNFNKGSDVTTGTTSVSEDYSRTSGEVGAGVQYTISKSSRAWADARYQHSIDGSSGHGYQFNAGVKWAF